MKLISSWKYHLSTILFFISINFFFLAFKKFVFVDIFDTPINYKYYVFEWLSIAFLLYLICNLTVIVLEVQSPQKLLTLKSITLVIGATCVLHLLFQIVLWPILEYSQTFLVPKENYFKLNTNLAFKHQLTNYCYFLFMSLNWLAFIYAYKIYELKQEDLKHKLTIETNLKEANLNTLKGQINPHFIFNSLNNIRGLVQEDPEKTKEMITRLSELLRSSLLSGNANLVPLEDEIELVENFLEISKIQYEDRLHFNIEVEKETEKLLVPPMILQMMVENAVKHGISTLKDGGIINIKTNISDENLQLLVENTGNINTTEGSTKIGLKNIEERINLLFNQNAKFELKEVDNLVIGKIIIPKNLINHTRS